MTKYEYIYQELVEKIKNNVYEAGDLLPGELELMKIYDASRDTIRKSLNLLVQDGYIQKSKGRGSIVLDMHRIEFPIAGVVSFKELAPELGNVKPMLIFYSRQRRTNVFNPS